MAISKASAHWDGGLKDGKGTMTPAHAPDVPFTAGSRFEGQPASNPEEMIGAALSGCYSMALSVALERAGLKPQSVHTSAEVHLERGEGGFSDHANRLDVGCEGVRHRHREVPDDRRRDEEGVSGLEGARRNESFARRDVVRLT